jgi:hypothetical protein
VIDATRPHESVKQCFYPFSQLVSRGNTFSAAGSFILRFAAGVCRGTKLVSRIPRNPLLGAVMGSSIGFLFPVCECGNVPVARRLLMQGVPAPAAIDGCERSKMSNGFYKPVFNPTYNLEMEMFRGQHVEYLVSDLLLLVTIAPLRKLLSE